MTDRLHIITERRCGFFSLFQQVIAHINWALRENRCPIVHFGSRCSYWTPQGYAGKKTVWEYYFEPIIPGWTVDAIPPQFIDDINASPLTEEEVYRNLGDGSLASCHFGDHPSLRGKALRIPFEWLDPSKRLRMRTYPIVRDYVRPREYIREKVEAFLKSKMEGCVSIGVHARGTDALFWETRRRESLILENYSKCIDVLLGIAPGAKILVATDEQYAIDYFLKVYGDRVIFYDTIRHQTGEPLNIGPPGQWMPTYVAANRDLAARNAEEAIVEFLLLRCCSYLVHNSSGLARTVLLAEPQMPYANVHLENSSWVDILSEPVLRKAKRQFKMFR